MWRTLHSVSDVAQYMDNKTNTLLLHSCWHPTKKHFRLRNKASTPEIQNFWGLHGPLLPQNQLGQMGGAEAPQLFQWVLRYEEAFRTVTMLDFRTGSSIGQPQIDGDTIEVRNLPIRSSRSSRSIVFKPTWTGSTFCFTSWSGQRQSHCAQRAAPLSLLHRLT